jgi:putative tricarboxylic transport membrane protein
LFALDPLNPWTIESLNPFGGSKMSREKAGALFFLLLSIGYGTLAFQIPLIFLSQGETFNARSMPYGLAATGVVLSLLILILPPVDAKKATTFRQALSGLDWLRAVYLIVLMVIYSLAISWIGFIVASIIFLMAGFYILGERNIKLILLASIPLVIVLWLLLSKILGMYIAPGELFYMIGLVQ